MSLNVDTKLAVQPLVFRPKAYAPADKGPADPTDVYEKGSVSALPKKPNLASATTAPSGPSLPLTATRSQQANLATHVAAQLGGPAFAHAIAPPDAAAATGSKVLRNPQTAARFVTNFNHQLGLDPADQATKDKLMVSSPAKFLRVNPALFYQDLKGPYAQMSQLLDKPAPQITIDGDAHLGNFGTVRDAKGDTIWGLNDYDMAAKGSPEADLERLATSIILFGKDAGMSQSDCLPLINSMAKSYADEIDKFKKGDPPDNSGLKSGNAWGAVKNFVDKQSKVSQSDMLKRFASKDKGGDFTKLQRNAELKDMSPSQKELVQGFLANYDKSQGKTPDLQRPIQVLDMANRIESGGSTYGLNRFYAMLKGTGKDPVILEIKQELPSAPLTPSGDLTKTNMPGIYSSMQAMGGTPNPLEAQATLNKTGYFIREREREKGSIDPTTLKPGEWKDLCQQAGMALAKAHAHQPGAGHDISKWIGDDEPTMSQNLQSFAVAYANQTEQDTKAYAQTLK